MDGIISQLFPIFFGGIERAARGARGADEAQPKPRRRRVMSLFDAVQVGQGRQSRARRMEQLSAENRTARRQAVSNQAENLSLPRSKKLPTSLKKLRIAARDARRYGGAA